MEGLIPFVIHAIKKSKTRSKYQSLSDESNGRSGGGSSRMPLAVEMAHDGSGSGPSRHRRTRSEFHPRSVNAVGTGCFSPSSDHAPRFRPSRSLREDPRIKMPKA